MLTEPLPSHFNVIATDVVGSSRGGYTRHDELISTTHRVLDKVIEQSGRAEEWIREGRGDGEMILAPNGVATAWLLATFLTSIKAELVTYNRNKLREDRLRLRFGMDCGDVLTKERRIVGGDPLVMAARLQNHQANRDAMDAVPAEPLSALISDAVYRRVVPHKVMGLMDDQFRKLALTIDDQEQICWLYMPGRQPPQVIGAADTPGPEPIRPEHARPEPAGPVGGGSTYRTKITGSSGFQVGSNNTMYHRGPSR